MHAPMVSVVVPVYNRAHLIMRAVASVLDQRFKDLELIIVDDASTDDLDTTLAGVADARIRLVKHKKNKGAAAARNTGIANAKGRYLAFLDSDDQWLPEKLERQLQFMRSDERAIRASCTGYVIFNQYHPEGEVRIGKSPLKQGDFWVGCRVSPGSTLLAEKAVFEEVGPFDDSLRRLEDWDWLLRYTEHSSLAIVPEVLTEVDYRAQGPDLAEVVVAIGVMKKKYIEKPQIPRSAQRRFLSALDNELAAAAYKNRRFGLAVLHFLKSLWHHPYRNMDTIKRITKTVWSDLFGRRN